jgi:hypothetical protein
MVEFFYSVVGSRAAISHGAFEMSCTIGYIWTKLTGIGAKWSSSIFLGFMVEEALLWIVLVGNFALLGFKVVKIYIADDIISTSPSAWFSLHHVWMEYARLGPLLV